MTNSSDPLKRPGDIVQLRTQAELDQEAEAEDFAAAMLEMVQELEQAVESERREAVARGELRACRSEVARWVLDYPLDGSADGFGDPVKQQLFTRLEQATNVESFETRPFDILTGDFSGLDEKNHVADFGVWAEDESGERTRYILDVVYSADIDYRLDEVSQALMCSREWCRRHGWKHFVLDERDIATPQSVSRRGIPHFMRSWPEVSEAIVCS